MHLECVGKEINLVIIYFFVPHSARLFTKRWLEPFPSDSQILNYNLAGVKTQQKENVSRYFATPLCDVIYQFLHEKTEAETSEVSHDILLVSRGWL